MLCTATRPGFSFPRIALRSHDRNQRTFVDTHGMPSMAELLNMNLLGKMGMFGGGGGAAGGGGEAGGAGDDRKGEVLNGGGGRRT